MGNGKSVGLSKETLIKRKRKNIITFFGQFVGFIFEMIGVILMQLLIMTNDDNHSLSVSGNDILDKGDSVENVKSMSLPSADLKIHFL